MKNITIKGFEHYLVDKNGNVYNTKCGTGIRTKGARLIKSWANKNTGYHTVVLRNGIDKPICQYVHRLVATTYLPNPLNLPEVNHKDFEKSNNNLDNLEWVTTKQNKFHSIINNINKTSKTKRIIKDDKLLKLGLDIWNKKEDVYEVAELWECSISSVYTILNKYNIERYRYDLPIAIRNSIIEDIKNSNINKFGKQFILYLNKKYNISLTHHKFYKIKKDAIGKKFIKTFASK
jgi:hypothetical protein